jgi:hypothetical protein
MTKDTISVDKHWLVMDIGCLECDAVSEVLGLFATEDEARTFADDFDGSKNHEAQVFNLSDVSR